MSLLSAKNEGEAEDPTDERPQRAEGAQRVAADVVVDGQPTGGEPRHYADERADPAGGEAGERGADVVPAISAEQRMRKTAPSTSSGTTPRSTPPRYVTCAARTAA